MTVDTLTADMDDLLNRLTTDMDAELNKATADMEHFRNFEDLFWYLGDLLCAPCLTSWWLRG